MNKTGFFSADILLPAAGNYESWAVVACDQFTSEPEYWERVEKLVGDQPSAFRLILPEAQLTDGHTEEHIAAINETMLKYQKDGVFREYPDSMIYLERKQSDGRIRRGVIGRIDLEEYDYSPDSQSLVRATEGTVLDRIPPRQAVRRNASLELPHIMLLIDDPDNTVIGPLSACTDVLYDFDMMEGGGHAKGYLLSEEAKAGVMSALEKLADQAAADPGEPKPLFCVGDGNHSLASAKAHYEEEKANARKEGMTDPENQLLSRYALVEVVNLYDDALDFEPIHRVLFDVDAEDLLSSLKEAFPGTRQEPVSDVYGGSADDSEPVHKIRFAWAEDEGILIIPHPRAQLEVGTLQGFLDSYLKEKGGRIDYVHGDDVTIRLGKQPGCIAFLLPAMDKNDLFLSIAADGPLPRKTFSMGHAADKRYYIEARKIK